MQVLMGMALVVAASIIELEPVEIWWTVETVECPEGTTRQSAEAVGSHAQWCTDNRTGQYHGPYVSHVVENELAVIVEGRLENGQWHGPYQRRDAETGALYYQGVHAHGKMVGRWRSWHPNGNLATDYTWNARGQRHGPSTMYAENGAPTLVQSYYENQLHGEQRSYFATTGRLYSKEVYEFGVQHGQRMMFHENGQLHWVGFLRDGKMDGPVSTYDAQGRRLSRGNYLQGSPIGWWTTWNHETGEVTETEYNWVPQSHLESELLEFPSH